MAKSILTERATSAKSDLWGSPRALAAMLVSEFDLSWDAAACQTTSVCGENYYGPDHAAEEHRDALSASWGQLWKPRFYMNPPFSELSAFCDKAVGEMLLGATIVALLPANKSEQLWWHTLIPYASEVRWLKGRLTYLEPESDPENADHYLLNGAYTAGSPALFPSCVVVWDGTKPKGLTGGPRYTFWDWKK
jgi:hypothetical protein